MDKELLTKRFDDLLDYLPSELKNPLKNLPPQIKIKTEEIRLRAGRPLSLTVMGSQFFVHQGGTCMLPRKNCLTVTVGALETVFLNLCRHSVYSHNEELCEGYISLNGGHRAGVCGRVVLRGGNIETIKDISSINLRIAKEVPHCADEIIKVFDGGGILICGGPGTGKTTLLRDIAHQLASGVMGHCLKVAIVDSRGEIAAVSRGVPSADIGSTTDIISGVPKGKGIEIALRTLYPDVIVFDELGNNGEVLAAMQSFNSGVTVITSVHAGTAEELKRRDTAKALLNSGAIKTVVLCHKGFKYSVHSADEFITQKQAVML